MEVWMSLLYTAFHKILDHINRKMQFFCPKEDFFYFGQVERMSDITL